MMFSDPPRSGPVRAAGQSSTSNAQSNGTRTGRRPPLPGRPRDPSKSRTPGAARRIDVRHPRSLTPITAGVARMSTPSLRAERCLLIHVDRRARSLGRRARILAPSRVTLDPALHAMPWVLNSRVSAERRHLRGVAERQTTRMGGLVMRSAVIFSPAESTCARSLATLDYAVTARL
jgi:hypothetical protein